MKILIAYVTYSGNTEEVAHYIKSRLIQQNLEIDLYEIGYGLMPNIAQYDRILLGTFTWEQGSTPDEMKDFVLDIGYKPDNIAVFGSGDTQFGGDDLFCLAVDKLVTFYHSKWTGLKIEQSPRGSQEVTIDQWLERVFSYDNIIAS